LGRRRILPGSIILLGSISQLERDGTAAYAEDWHSCRLWLREVMGDLMVLPLIPIPMATITDRSTIRSLLEFFTWFQSLPDPEVKLLSETRRKFVDLYIPKGGVGIGWCDERQCLRMPESLAGGGKTTVNSKNWGNRPTSIQAFRAETEKYWAGVIVADLNMEFSLNLSTCLGIQRRGRDIRLQEASLHKVEILLAGGSNASNMAAALGAARVSVDSMATPGWRLSEDRVGELLTHLDTKGKNCVAVLYGLDNTLFVSVDEDLRSCPPYRGRDGKYHAHGRMELVSGYAMELTMDLLKKVMLGCKGRQLILVGPMPRFWIPCCDKLEPGNAGGSTEDRKRLVKELGKVRRAVISLSMKLHVSQAFHYIDPLAALRVDDDDVRGMEQVMADPVHLFGACYRKLAEEVVKAAATLSEKKRKVETEDRPHGDWKRARLDSGHGGGGYSGGPSGSRGGYTGGKRRGNWQW
jgi:hypothetical protein